MLKEIRSEDIITCRAAEEICGYAHPAYIHTLTEFGTPLQLQSSKSWLLARKIPGTERIDAIGAYPFFACDDYQKLIADLDNLDKGLVSVAIVPDPATFFPQKKWMQQFDVATPFKTHYIAELDVDFRAYLRRHHRRYASRALSSLEVQLAHSAADYGIEWAKLYSNLVARHNIAGLRAFSATSLGMQLQVPGCHYFRALHNGEVVGGFVCYLDRGVAYAHLISTTSPGQKLMAQYALYWEAIEYFRTRARWFMLGSTPSLDQSAGKTGLDFFKAGWATSTCKAFFLGRILDRESYNNLASLTCIANHKTFPSYRSGEFG